jgi:NADPH-dependent 2,4-dienoyl-CoA reductase/sulfur reductase-like enzyme/rhodanese-related sulfurtransferase
MSSRPTRIVVIGGSAAGLKAAAKARRTDEFASITLIQREPELSMASCGLLHDAVGGNVGDHDLLVCAPAEAVRDPMLFGEAKGFEAKVETEALHIDRQAKTVSVQDLASGAQDQLPYDRLVIATGAAPMHLDVPGIELEGVHTLHSVGDAEALQKVCKQKRTRKAVVVGGGLIGLEVCKALRLARIDTRLVEKNERILQFLDAELARLVEMHLDSRDVEVLLGNGIARFIGKHGRLTGVELTDGNELACQLAVLAVGVQPNVSLAKAAGLEIGTLGGIRVNDFMQTSDPDIFAVGDCVECKSLITGRPIRAPYGDTAKLQGRVAGQNLIKPESARFPGVTHTGIYRFFDYTIGFTGLSEQRARAEGFTNIETVTVSGLDMPVFQQGELLISKMLADRDSGRILGYQCIGPGDASKRVVTVAMAIRGKLSVEDLAHADLPYAPPYSLALDHGIVAAHALENKLEGRMQGISINEVKQRIDSRADSFFLDMRSPLEFDEMRLGIGETLIPLAALRDCLDELPEDKDREIILYCKTSLRGYEGAAILRQHGWKNVKIMEGGLVAWPYARAK